MIEYSFAVTEEIRAQAVSGFHSFGHGGLETGGVLYGVVEAGVTRVLGSAELSCEHALGPGFVLSDNDREAFEKLLQAPAGMQAVGWYASHTRTGLTLGAADLEIFDRFFGRPGAIALLVEPINLGPAQATFFYRAEDGAIRSGGQEAVFLLDGAPRRRAAKPVVVEAPVVEEKRPSGKSETLRTGRWFRLPHIAAALGAVALAVLFYSLMRRAPEGLGLQAHAVSAGQVRIEWNRGSPAFAGAGGVLEIDDGGSLMRVPLSGEQLRTSSITYAHQSPRVSVRLRVERSKGAPLEETVAYVGKIAPAPAPPSPQEPAVTVQPEPPPQAARIPEARPPQPETAKAESAEHAPETAAPVTPLRRFAPPAPPTQQARPVAALPGPPVLTPGAASAPALPLPSHVPVAAPPPRAPAYAGPRSGRLIWTGDLARRGVVEVEGSQASVGVLAGALPGVPVSVRVSPAQFTSDGLVVYTADAARNGRSEPASAANGWNHTRFEWDPQRSREIAVLEWPNPSNQYKRLALRNDARNCAVIVIEWSAQ